MKRKWGRRTLNAFRMSLSNRPSEPTDDDMIVGSLGSVTAALTQTPEALAASKFPCTPSRRIEDLSFVNGALLQEIDHYKRRLFTIEPHLSKFQELGEACGKVVEEFSKAMAHLNQEMGQELGQESGPELDQEGEQWPQ